MQSKQWNFLFTAIFASFAIVIVATLTDAVLNDASVPWSLLFSVFISVVMCSLFQVRLGNSRIAPTVGVSVIVLTLAPESGHTALWVSVWAAGFALAQFLLRRSALYALYTAGVGAAGGCIFIAVQIALVDFGFWLPAALLLATISYYLFVICVETLRIHKTSRQPLGRIATASNVRRTIRIVLLVTLTTALMHFGERYAVGVIEQDTDANRTPALIIVTSIVFFVIAQRTRFLAIERQLNEVIEATLDLPRITDTGFVSALTDRTSNILQAASVTVQRCPPTRTQLGVKLDIAETDAQFLVATHQIGGAHFTREDKHALHAIAAAASHSSQLRSQVKSLEKQVRSDPLTGLPNYSAFQVALEAANIDRPFHEAIAILFFDLDNFKAVNEAAGHRVGDQLLQAVAQRLQSAAAATDYIARLGSDEFVVLLTGLSSEEQAREKAEHIIQHVSQPLHIADTPRRPILSAGLSYSAHREFKTEPLLLDADRAMLQSKRERRAAGITNSSSFSTSSQRINTTNETLAKRICDNDIDLAYQPIVNLNTGQVWAFEALLRYVDPELGHIDPPSLITRAKSIGLMNELTQVIVNTALGAAEDFRTITPSIRCMTINLELNQISATELGPFIAAAAAAHPNIALCVELNERSLHAATSTLRCDAETLQASGVLIALDDYGSHDSSVGSLVHFPMNILKIDKSLINDLTDPRQKELLRILNSYGQTFTLTTVVEGIETQAMSEQLQAIGVSNAQGYYYGRPAPASKTLERLAHIGAAIGPHEPSQTN